jgi:hypothetical protein
LKKYNIKFTIFTLIHDNLPVIRNFKTTGINEQIIKIYNASTPKACKAKATLETVIKIVA